MDKHGLDTDAGKREPREMRVGVVGVFDGHGGEEASDMASKLFMDYFLLHTIFNIYKKMIAFNKEQDTDLQSKEGDESLQMKILREALLRTIHEIDLKFSEASVPLFHYVFEVIFLMTHLVFSLLSGSCSKQSSCRIHSHCCCYHRWSNFGWECWWLKGPSMLRKEEQISPSDSRSSFSLCCLGLC